MEDVVAGCEHVLLCAFHQVTADDAVDCRGGPHLKVPLAEGLPVIVPRDRELLGEKKAWPKDILNQQDHHLDCDIESQDPSDERLRLETDNVLGAQKDIYDKTKGAVEANFSRGGREKRVVHRGRKSLDADDTTT